MFHQNGMKIFLCGQSAVRTNLVMLLAALFLVCSLSTWAAGWDHKPPVVPHLDPAEHVIATAMNPDPDVYPTIHLRLHSREIAFCTVLYPGVPGYRADGCLYEPSDGFLWLNFIGVRLPADNVLQVLHRVRDNPSLIHVTTLTAKPGKVELVASLEIDSSASTKNANLPKTLGLTPNLCWGWSGASNFAGGGNRENSERKENYINWISRCFIFTEKGRTFLSDTERRMTAEVPKDDPRNNPVRPQHYIGVWQDYKTKAPHPNTSPDRYIFPLIGAVSNDGKFFTAIASPTSRYVAQAWHTCLHHIPTWEGSDGPLMDQTWRVNLYLGEDDPQQLLEQAKKDFPEAAKLK